MNSLFVNAGLVDKILLYVHPVLLGDGIPLFSQLEGQVDLQLLKQHTFSRDLMEQVFKVSNTPIT